MSASLVTPPGDRNEVTVQVGGTNFKGWQNVSITRSCESMPNSFTVTAASAFLQGPGLAGTAPDRACNVLIGTDTVITGWIDRRVITADRGSHSVTLSGRGICRNLVDCSANIDDPNDPAIKGGMINAKNTLDLAQKLCHAFKIEAYSAVPDLGIPILTFQVALGETPYEIIESVARYAGYLVYEDQNGALVLDRVGTKSMASGFAMPGNIEAISAERSVDGRYTDYIVTWYGIDTLSEPSPLGNQRATAKDKFVAGYRPLIRVSAQISPAYDVGLAMANWEYARRRGRSQAVSITCDSWRDGDRDAGTGKLWTPNMLAPIEAPGADITGANWIISSVVFRKDMSGTHADLVLMPPSAFEPQPNPLNLWDNELMGKPPTSQSPAPPSTNPAHQTPSWLPGPAVSG